MLQFAGVRFELFQHHARAPHENPGVPERALIDQRIGQHRRRLFHEMFDAARASFGPRYERIEGRTGLQVTEACFAACGLGPQRHQHRLRRRNGGGPAQRIAEDVGKADGQVGVQRAEHGIGSGAIGDLLRAPCQCGRRTERTRLNEHVGARNLGNGFVQRIGNVGAGDHQHTFGRHQRRETGDGVGNERSLVHESQQLFRPFGRTEWPETGADATGEDHGPQRSLRFEQGLDLELLHGICDR